MSAMKYCALQVIVIMLTAFKYTKVQQLKILLFIVLTIIIMRDFKWQIRPHKSFSSLFLQGFFWLLLLF